MAVPKRKPDTETLRTEARAALEAIDKDIAEHDAQRLDLDPQAAIAKDLALLADVAFESLLKNQGREFSGALLVPLAQSLFLASLPIAPAPHSF